MIQCLFCESSAPARTIRTREMMFGMRHEFDYDECGACGSLQIRTPPADLSEYYPPGYLSFSDRHLSNAFRRKLKAHRFRHELGDGNLLGRITSSIWGPEPLAAYLKRAGASTEDAVLEVGCGYGELLTQMVDSGFTHLTGIDPFIPREITLAPGAHIHRRSIHEMTGSFDLIIYNHTLEHVPSPFEELRKVAELIGRGKYALIRLPVAGTAAFRTYGADWVQLDPPRHLAIPTPEGMRSLAARTGFSVEHVVFDSTAFQFWGSEQYRRDIPLKDPRSYENSRPGDLFSKDEIRRWSIEAERLNADGDGDTACFFLRRD